MSVPFSSAEFEEVFAAYNSTLWPAVVVLWLASAAAVVLLVARKRQDRVLSALLAFHWAWSAIAYHLAFFARINPAARVFAGLFLVQAGLFLWLGVLKSHLSFSWNHTPRHFVAGALGVYALAYPFLLLLSGHHYPQTPMFGVPCPTTLFTIALLLSVDPPLPRSLVVVPLIWSLIGGSAAVLFGVTPDLMLVLAGTLVALYAAKSRGMMDESLSGA
jgi:hypothetical protein